MPFYASDVDSTQGDDLVDAIFCAYLAYYFWYLGDERCWIVGDMNNGYVVLPRCRLTKLRIGIQICFCLAHKRRFA